MDHQERHFLEGMNEGEMQLYHKCLWLEDDDFRLIPNAMFQRVDEGTNQIDLIAVTKKGLFVMEMKDYKGWIFGDENHKMWTQTLQSGFRGSRKYQLRNPVKQNENHIKTVRSLLAGKGINDLPIYNVIVFGNEAVLKEISTSVDVVNLLEITSVFGKYRDLVISKEELKEVYDYLVSLNLKDEESRRSHLEYVNSLKNSGATAEPLQDEVKKDDWELSHDAGNPGSSGSARKPNKQANESPQKPRKVYVVLMIVLTIAFAYLLLPVLWPLLVSVGLGYLGIRFRDRRAFGMALLLGIYGIGSLSFTSPSSVNQPSNPSPEEQSIVQSSDHIPAEEISNNAKLKEQLEKLQQEVREIEAMELGTPEVVPEHEVIVVELDQKETSQELQEQVPDEELIGQTEFIDMGIGQDQVKRILGEPEKIEMWGTNKRWSYGISHVVFDEYGGVVGWHNYGGRLEAGMRKPVAEALPFDIGSTKEDVLQAVGAAIKIEASNPDKWYYGLAWISFDQNGYVNGWHNYNSSLEAGMRKPVTGAPTFDIGSTKEDVQKAVGAAIKIEASNPVRWYYGLAWINFDKNGQVNGWHNYNSSLEVGMRKPVAGAPPFGIGSTKEDVQKAVGAAIKIEASNPVRWYYGLAWINFDQNGQVNGWNNHGNQFGEKVLE